VLVEVDIADEDGESPDTFVWQLVLWRSVDEVNPSIIVVGP